MTAGDPRRSPSGSAFALDTGRTAEPAGRRHAPMETLCSTDRFKFMFALQINAEDSLPLEDDSIYVARLEATYALEGKLWLSRSYPSRPSSPKVQTVFFETSLGESIPACTTTRAKSCGLTWPRS